MDVNETKSLVSEYIEEFNVKLPVLVDRYGVVDEKGVGNLPTLYIIGADGQVTITTWDSRKGTKKPMPRSLPI